MARLGVLAFASVAVLAGVPEVLRWVLAVLAAVGLVALLRAR